MYNRISYKYSFHKLQLSSQEAPVVARAALLLECAQFIHRCNHGDWPNWMRLNLPSFRQSTSALQNRGQPSGYRRTLALQKSAGRMFYKWAEVRYRQTLALKKSAGRMFYKWEKVKV
jgi:site-specific recombinase XerC